MQWKEKWVGPNDPKTTFVQPPLSKKYWAIETTFAPAPPTWAAILAWETKGRINNPNLNFQVLHPPQADMSTSFLNSCAEADILGITDWFSCHQSAMEIVTQAKKINPKLLTIIGGINAKYLALQILKNHFTVDLVVSGDGEDILWRIQKGQQFTKIPNLWFRDKNGIPQFSHHQIINLDEIGSWDFEGLIDKTILEEYKKSLNQNPYYTVPLGVSLTRGCRKCRQQKPCIYCTTWGKYRETAPQKAINQLRHLERSGYRYLFETGDDFSSVDYLKQLVNLRRFSDNFKIRCYSDPINITQQVANLMAEVGIYETFLGFETASGEIAVQANRHKNSANIVKTAIVNLQKVNISVCLPVMFGLPGETTKTAEMTIKVILDLIEKHPNIRLVLVSLAIPLIGSVWFKKLATNKKIQTAYNTNGKDLNLDDEFNYFRLLELSLQQGGTKIKDIIQIMKKLKEELQDRVTLGSFGAIETSKTLAK